jgi:hypothetical protein
MLSKPGGHEHSLFLKADWTLWPLPEPYRPALHRHDFEDQQHAGLLSQQRRNRVGGLQPFAFVRGRTLWKMGVNKT